MSHVKNIVILISGRGSNMATIIDAHRQGKIPANIALVVSNKADAGGLKTAAQAGVSTAVLETGGYRDREAYDQALVELIDAQRPDIVVLAGFMRILSPVFTRHFSGRLINIHPSLLPLYPGLHTHRRVLASGDRQHGATVHFVNEELDQGPAILQAALDVHAADTEETLSNRVLTEIEHRIYPVAVQWFIEGRIKLDGNRVRLDDELLPEIGFQYPGNRTL